MRTRAIYSPQSAAMRLRMTNAEKAARSATNLYPAVSARRWLSHRDRHSLRVGRGWLYRQGWTVLVPVLEFGTLDPPARKVLDSSSTELNTFSSFVSHAVIAFLKAASCFTSSTGQQYLTDQGGKHEGLRT